MQLGIGYVHSPLALLKATWMLPSSLENYVHRVLFANTLVYVTSQHHTADSGAHATM